MARSRNIKPGFFTNDELAEIEPLGRLLFAGLWTIADREGRLEDRPKKIKIEVLPYDDCDVDSLLQKLTDKGFILRYEINGARYIQIITFTEHQNPHKNEKPSTLPAPELYGTSTVQASFKNSTSSIQEQFNNESSIVQGMTVALEQKSVSSVLEEQESSKIKASNDSDTSTVQAPDKNSTNLVMHSTNRADSFNMIPDSFNQTIDYSPPVVDNFNLVGGNKLADSDSGNGDAETSNDFMNFWNEYPRRQGLDPALEAWGKLMKKGIPSNDVVRAAKKYAGKVRMDQVPSDRVTMPHTFLNNGMFKDYAPTFAPDCPLCRGSGYILTERPDGTSLTIECSCSRRLDTA
jgi:hypothetical protein